MNYKILVAYFLMLVSVSVFSQTPNVTFGKVDLPNLNMKVYPKDSSVEAVVLYDYASVRFGVLDKSYSIVTDYHKRIKILKKSALDQATVKLYVANYGFGKTEVISNIQGFTYNAIEHGFEKEKLTKDMIATENSSEKFQTKKLNFPKVKEGSIIEFTYTKETPFSLQVNPDTWEFQGELPVEWSEYNISVPEYFYYKLIMSGYLTPFISENTVVPSSIGDEAVNATNYRIVIKDAPAFKNEPFITTAKDYISNIEFQLASVRIPPSTYKDFSLDYENINTTLLNEPEFGGILKKTSFMRDVSNLIKAQSKDSTQQIELAVQYLANKMKYNGGTSIYSKNLKKLLEKGEGDDADINFALIALLRELGFDANPVILSTRDHGRLHLQYGILKRFNYVVAHISRNGKDVFLDATDKYQPIGCLPIKCLNQNGWLVHATQGRMLNIKPTAIDSELIMGEMKINEEDEIEGSFSKQFGGYSALRLRNKLAEESKDSYIEQFKKNRTSWTFGQIEFQNLDSIGKKVNLQCKVAISDNVQNLGNMIYFSPLLTEGYSKNPFKDSERNFPVDFAHPIDQTYFVTFEIPKGYTVAEMPKNVALTMPENGGKFLYSANIIENKINVQSKITIKKPVYYANEYFSLKAFFDNIVSKHVEKIVLKKDI